jgi:hypothetical protein
MRHVLKMLMQLPQLLIVRTLHALPSVTQLRTEVAEPRRI